LNGDEVAAVVPNGLAPNDEPNPPNEGATSIALKIKNTILFLIIKYDLPTDAVGCDCPKPENIDCDAGVAAAAPNPKVGAVVVAAAPNPNVGAALVVAAPKPKEEA